MRYRVGKFLSSTSESLGQLVVCQDSFEGLVRVILDFGFWILDFGFWILHSHCPIPHFKIDRPLVELVYGGPHD